MNRSVGRTVLAIERQEVDNTGVSWLSEVASTMISTRSLPARLVTRPSCRRRIVVKLKCGDSYICVIFASQHSTCCPIFQHTVTVVNVLAAIRQTVFRAAIVAWILRLSKKGFELVSSGSE